MKLKINKDVFEFVEHLQADVYNIRIKKGRFKNVIYQYGPVRFEEDKETEQLKFNFEFGINCGNSRYTKEELLDSNKFKQFIADVLVYIMEEDLASQLETKINNDELITTDSEESM